MQLADLLGEVERRPARYAEQRLAPGRIELRQGARRQLPALALEQRLEADGLRRPGRAHAEGPASAQRWQVLAGQIEPVHGDRDAALAVAAEGAHRNAQGAALAVVQFHLQRRLAALQRQLAFTAQLHLQRLRLAREVAEVQRQAGFVAAGEEARRRQLGHQRRGDHRLRLGHAEALVGPGLRHQPQLAVEVRNIEADLALALVIQGHRLALQGDDVDAGLRRLAALAQRRGVTAESQAGQASTALDQLPVDVQLVGTVGLAAEHRDEGIGGLVIGDVEDADVHRGEQHAHLPRRAAIGFVRLYADLQRLVGAHPVRRRQAQRQFARSAIQRQVQQADGALRRGVALALARTNHQRADVQVMPRPFFGDRHLEGLAFDRHLDFLPPERAVGGLHQQVTAAGGRRRHADLRRVAFGIGRLVQRQLDLVRTYRTALGVVLPAVAGPEAQTADHPGLRVFNLDAIRAPLHREGDFRGAVGGHRDALLGEVQVLLVVVIAPAVVGGEVPVVVAALAHQAHLEVVGGQLVAARVGHQHLEFGLAVAVHFLAVEQPAQPRQALGRPHRLLQATGDRPPTGLLQPGLQRQLQRRARLGPAAVEAQRRLALGIQGGFVEVQVLAQLFLGNRAELVAGQRRHGFAQRPDVKLAAELVAGSRRAVEVAPLDLELRGIARRQRRVAALQVQRQAFGEEILDEEFIELRLAVAQVEQQLPAPGRCIGGQRQRVLVETALARRPDELAAELLIGLAYLDIHRLRRHRLAIGVAQQGVEQDRLAGAVEVARAEDEELQRVRGGAGDVELGQVQRRGSEAQQAGLRAVAGDQHLRLVLERQFGVTTLLGLAAGQQRALVVEQFQGDAIQRLAAFQRLGEHVQAVGVAVRGETDVAQGEQRGRLRVAVLAGLAHHRQVDARLLERLEPGDRQQQVLAGVARRIQIEAPAVDQIGHRQQFAGFPAAHRGAAAPAFEERRQAVRFDAEELDVDLVDVQRDHRQAFHQPRRQQRTGAGEADAGLQVTGFQACDVLGGEAGAARPAQAGIHRQHQLALRLEVAQTQLHEVVRQLPGAVDLAILAVDQMQFVGEGLIGVQRHAEAHRQCGSALDLDFRDIGDAQLAPGITLRQGRAILLRGGGLLRRGRRRWRAGGLLRRRRIAGAQQHQGKGQEESFLLHHSLQGGAGGSAQGTCIAAVSNG